MNRKEIIAQIQKTSPQVVTSPVAAAMLKAVGGK